MSIPVERDLYHDPENAPECPENADVFVLVSGRHLFAASAVNDFEGELPADAERTRSGGAVFTDGMGIPAGLITESTWRGSWRDLVPLNADGEALEVLPREKREPTPRERAVDSFRSADSDSTRADAGADANADDSEGGE